MLHILVRRGIRTWPDLHEACLCAIGPSASCCPHGRSECMSASAALGGVPHFWGNAPVLVPAFQSHRAEGAGAARWNEGLAGEVAWPNDCEYAHLRPTR